MTSRRGQATLARMAKKKATHGGARPGAGRKPKFEGEGGIARRITVSLAARHDEELRAVREDGHAETDTDAVLWCIEESARRRARRPRA